MLGLQRCIAPLGGILSAPPCHAGQIIRRYPSKIAPAEKSLHLLLLWLTMHLWLFTGFPASGSLLLIALPCVQNHPGWWENIMNSISWQEFFRRVMICANSFRFVAIDPLRVLWTVILSHYLQIPASASLLYFINNIEKSEAPNSSPPRFRHISSKFLDTFFEVWCLLQLWWDILFYSLFQPFSHTWIHFLESLQKLVCQENSIHQISRLLRFL